MPMKMRVFDLLEKIRLTVQNVGIRNFWTASQANGEFFDFNTTF